MDNWLGRIAVVTGASAGIGADVISRLASLGVMVVGLARRKEKIEELAETVNADDKAKGSIFAMECDVTDEQQVATVFDNIESTFGGISILINNAGISRSVAFHGKTSTKGWKEVLDTNVLGLTLCTRYALNSMLKHKVDDGQIININSICGHTLPTTPGASMSMYYASKHAVTVLTEGLRQELNGLKSKIRVASLSPGLVKTEIIDCMGDPNFTGEQVYKAYPYLDPENITDGIIYILSAPPKVNVYELTIKPVGESS